MNCRCPSSFFRPVVVYLNLRKGRDDSQLSDIRNRIDLILVHSSRRCRSCQSPSMCFDRRHDNINVLIFCYQWRCFICFETMLSAGQHGKTFTLYFFFFFYMFLYLLYNWIVLPVCPAHKKQTKSNHLSPPRY